MYMNGKALEQPSGTTQKSNEIKGYWLGFEITNSKKIPKGFDT